MDKLLKNKVLFLTISNVVYIQTFCNNWNPKLIVLRSSDSLNIWLCKPSVYRYVKVIGYFWCLPSYSSVVWQNFSWWDIIYTSSHPRWGTEDKPKYRYHLSSISWMNEFYRMMVEGYLQAQKWLKAAPSGPTTGWLTAHKRWEPGAHCITRRQLNSLDSVLSTWLWFKPLPGRWLVSDTSL